ncbi:Ankyrin repeat [Homalodisca vitripennis]|nr:Ankyrin repeat [Homalodisca vitripennis]
MKITRIGQFSRKCQVCGEVEALETVLEAGAMSSCPDMHGGYPLHYAAQMCGPAGEIGSSRLGLSVLHALLSHGVEVNVTDQDGRQPILWAASAGCVLISPPQIDNLKEYLYRLLNTFIFNSFLQNANCSE